MAWENATGFGSKINPVILPNNLLSLISDNDVGGSQSLYFSTRDYPTGVVVNTNYNNLPITGNNVYASYESSELMDWEYANWTEGNTILGAGIKVFINGVERYQYSQRWQVSNSIVPSYGFVVNHSLQRAKIVSCSLGTTYFEVEVMTTTNYNDDLYNALMNNPYTPYTWSSVPAISGKNGILSLTKILNINDGEPVENVTNKGNLDFSKKTKVNTLVNSVYEPTYKEDASKATVEYEIPEAEYQYTKLVYKKKKIPKSASDGTAIDIGADDTEAVVTGLEENSTYYFVVFTNRTKSNAYKFKTGKSDAPEGIFKLKVTIDKALLDNDIKDFVSYDKLT